MKTHSSVEIKASQPRRKGTKLNVSELEKNPAKIPPGQVQVKTNTHIWHVGVYIGYRPEVQGPAVIHFQNRNQEKKVPAVGPGKVHFQHIRAFLAPYNTDQLEYVPNDLTKRGPRPPHQIVEMAFSLYRQGFGDYNCALNNCEDFSLQCCYTNPPLLSDQTKGYAAYALAGAVGGLILTSTALRQASEAYEQELHEIEKLRLRQERRQKFLPACFAPKLDM